MRKLSLTVTFVPHFLLAVFVLTSLGYSQDARTTGAQKNLCKRMQCSAAWVITTEEAGPDFSVLLSYNKSPIANAKVVVNGDIVVTSETDGEGVAKFVGIPPGRYEIYVDGGLDAPWSELNVKAETANNKIRFEWPKATIAVRNLRGELFSAGALDSDPLPLESASIELLDLRTAAHIAKSYTDVAGHYEFPSSSPGLYVLRISLPQKQGSVEPLHGDMVVELSSQARDEDFPPMKIKEAECGELWLSTLERFPDKALYDRAIIAAAQRRFDVAHLTLQTLVNTYPDSEYAAKAKVLLQDEEIGNCGGVWSIPDCDDLRLSTKK
jgi:hypothetical protein